MKPEDRIIVALDFDDVREARGMIRSLEGRVGYFKVGLELMTALGTREAVALVHGTGGRIFADTKFDDIPNTVAGAVRSLAGLGADMFNVHASAGMESMKAARANKGKSKAIAVTLLTSISDAEAQLLFGASSSEVVMRFAKMTVAAGLDGIVCSAAEVAAIKAEPETNGLLTVTPGIRPVWAAAQDQRRIVTPAQAARDGADYLVIGRPITEPPAAVGSPVRAVERIIEEIEAA
jgi:orotidine-5'-phosphate decarboxylase